MEQIKFSASRNKILESEIKRAKILVEKAVEKLIEIENSELKAIKEDIGDLSGDKTFANEILKSLYSINDKIEHSLINIRRIHNSIYNTPWGPLLYPNSLNNKTFEAMSSRTLLDQRDELMSFVNTFKVNYFQPMEHELCEFENYVKEEITICLKDLNVDQR